MTTLFQARSRRPAPQRRRSSIGTWALATCIITQLACDDQLGASYASLAEARQAGAIQRGWLPALLPESSRNITETHNIDTNQTWCMFEFAPEDAERLQERVTALDDAAVRGVYVRPPGVAWWPGELEGTLSPSALAAGGLRLYRADRAAVIAIDWKARRAYFYRERA